MKITDNERMVLNQFNADKKFYSFWDQGYVTEDSGTYLSEFIPEMARAMGKPESSARPVFTGMKKKGIFTTRDVPAEEPIMTTDGTTEVQAGKPADLWVELTDVGVEMISDLRLEEDEAMLDLEEDEEEEDLPESEEEELDEPIVDTVIKAAARKRRAETAGLKAAAKESIAQGKPSLRTSHADCSHATQGKEGKMARAKCRRERAAAAKLAEEKAEKKAARIAAKANA